MFINDITKELSIPKMATTFRYFGEVEIPGGVQKLLLVWCLGVIADRPLWILHCCGLNQRFFHIKNVLIEH